MLRSSPQTVAIIFLFLMGSMYSRAQSSATPSADIIQSLVRQTVAYQLADFHHTTYGLRYRLHRSDRKEDSVREVVETSTGNIARTVQRNGKPLTPEQDAAEIKRLQTLAASDLERHRSDDRKTDQYATELMTAMPTAMIYSLAPGQPQMNAQTHRQTVLDFTPDPAFHPRSTAQSLLTGLAGRIWIDAETHHLLRIEIHIVHDLGLFFGILARVYSGGTLVYEQAAVGEGHYAFRHIAIDVRLRELMVKTVPYRSTLDAAGTTMLQPPPSFADGIKLLLAPSVNGN